VNRGRSSDTPEPAQPVLVQPEPIVVQPEPVLVHSITTAVQAHSADMDARIRRYLISMGIRTVCVILVLVIHSPVRWAFAVLAVLLPYIAVVMANAAGNRRGKGAGPVPVSRIALPIVTNGEKPVTVRVSSEQPNSHSHEQTA
jgi:hypothetical protein